MALSGNNKASGHKFVSPPFCDLIRLSGEQRFVDLHLSGGHYRVRADLVPGLKYYNIVNHKLFRVDHRALSVPHYSSMRSVQHRQVIQNLFRPDLLHDSDQRIGNDDRKKRQVPERTDQTEQHGQNDKDQVEICKYIFMDDLFRRLGRRLYRPVCPAVQAVFLHLLAGQSLPVIRIIPRCRYPPVSLRMFRPLPLHFTHR